MPHLLATLALCLLGTEMFHAQDPTPNKPIPDIPTLMRDVEVHQRQAEAVEKDYIYRGESTFNEVRSDGSAKKTDERVFDLFWIDGVQVQRLIRKNAKDLTPDELKKEDSRIDKEVAKAREKRGKADNQGKETDSHGNDEITLSRILELGTFSNPRRVLVSGRPTIAVDYTGDPHAKTHNSGEGALRLLAGTVSVDEEDKALQHMEGRFTANYKVGAGLVADIKAGTSFSVTALRINNEVWLPSSIDAQGHLRYLLFFSLNGNAHIHFSDYRKFKATSTILPNKTPAADLPPEAPATPSPPPS